MRNLASIQKVLSVEPIEGADAIELIKVLGWQVVCKKGEFKAGDLVVYCEIDSILPKRPEFEFLESRKYRIRTIRLRKTLSQGICFPLDILPKSVTIKEGVDVTDALEVTKYDPEEVANKKRLEEHQKRVPKNKLARFLLKFWICRFIWWTLLGVFTKPSKRGTLPFPTDIISKTDETRIQTYTPEVFLKLHRYWFSATEKLEGQSGTFFLRTAKYNFLKFFKRSYKEFGVCSRNQWLVSPKHKGSWWRVAEEYNIKDKLSKVPFEVSIQGEIIGEGIQDNYYEIKGYQFYVFNVKNLSTGTYLSNPEVKEFCREYGFDMVPEVFVEFKLPDTVEELLKVADGASLINSKKLREGLVFRSNCDEISFKAISNIYILKNDR